MLKNKLYMTLLGLTGIMVAPAVLSSSQVTPEVQLIFGTGFSPKYLKAGDKIRGGTTTITADKKTIVVLLRSWSFTKKKVAYNCEDWIIIRNRNYSVEKSAPDACPEKGSGNEVAQAMRGASTLAHFTKKTLAFSDPKADMRTPRDLQKLMSDLYKLQQKADRDAKQRNLKKDQKRYGTTNKIPVPAKTRFATIVQSPKSDALPTPNKPIGFIKSRFRVQQKDSTWFVSGLVKNMSRTKQPCVRLRFRMNTSDQDIQKGARSLMLGVLEVELRDLAAGEKRKFSQALATRVKLYKETTEKCR